MRVAIAIHGFDLPAIIETYDLLSRGLYSHASPTMWSACCTNAAYASCYIYRPDAETFDSVMHSILDVSKLWQSDGGIGLDLGSVPATRYV